ncbi:DUF1792 domain-containing protein [Companilactobacillus zhachilii]|uniref:DUF1792 domain-containing protein n=1 Tax=Companilactobacillus zhachilii TaxID=2304606 RepID=A0A386PSN5_9LACO|nr:GT-D fold domain-containing glycosyltransferase [Companilactobacillus zhachilii]AYE39026.1 DUF1792 domain-containing protein [Companilactobacillus zhachilii]
MKKRVSKFIPFWVKLLISSCLYMIFRMRIKLKRNVPSVRKFENTVDYIIDNEVSVSRFGDGEFKWIFQNRENGNFEINSPELARALERTLQTKKEKLLICIPDVFSGLTKYNSKAKEFWGLCLGRYGMSWVDKIAMDYEYGDTQFTRPYMDYQDKTGIKVKFDLLKRIWENRDVLIVEGTKSRFGIGNNLLSNTKSTKRILAPEVNAFEKYDDIKNEILKNIDGTSNTLVLLSLGPTATVLASELTDYNIQAIDIGHLDIEYSWFLMGAMDKVPVEGKYVNEVPIGGHKIGKISDSKLNKEYHSEVISIVGD